MRAAEPGSQQVVAPEKLASGTRDLRTGAPAQSLSRCIKHDAVDWRTVVPKQGACCCGAAK